MTIYTLIAYLQQFPSDTVIEFHKWDHDHEEQKHAHILEEMIYDPDAKKLIL